MVGFDEDTPHSSILCLIELSGISLYISLTIVFAIPHSSAKTDIFFVFGTDVMMTVALKIEAPVKFLYPAPPSDVPREYPFSVLGLGDIVVPGFFVRFMTKVDDNLGGNFSYATVTTIAYGLGLAICFVVNEVTKSGQPALLYLNPACIGASLACGAANGQLTEVWNFEDPDAPKISSP